MTMNFKISWTLQKFLISLNSILTNSYNTWLTHFVHMSFYLPVAKLPQKQCYLNGQEIFISCPEVPCEWGEHLNGALIFLFVLFSLKWGLPCMKRARSVRSFMSIFKKQGFFFFFYTADLKWVRVWGVNVLWMNTLHQALGWKLHTNSCLKGLNISQAEQDRHIAQVYGYTEQGALKGPEEWGRWSNQCVLH